LITYVSARTWIRRSLQVKETIFKADYTKFAFIQSDDSFEILIVVNKEYVFTDIGVLYYDGEGFVFPLKIKLVFFLVLKLELISEKNYFLLSSYISFS
jgi:hypothetical protein